MEKTLKIINQLESKGTIESYAIGGAVALLFYTEPALTFDLDIFIFLPTNNSKNYIISLGPIYEELKKMGYKEDKEHIVIEGIPVQFIPVYSKLVEEAVNNADVKPYMNLKTKVIKIEYLIAIMVDTNRPKDRERINQLLEVLKIDRKKLFKILDKYKLKQKWDKNFEKI